MDEEREQDIDRVEDYLRTIPQAPLLSSEEEVQLAQLVEHGKAECLKGEQLHILPDRRLIEVAREAEQRLTEANLRLVVSVAKKYMGHGMSLMDLIQVGNIGLARAVGQFDPTTRRRFTTHAVIYIHQSIAEALGIESPFVDPSESS